MPDTPFSLPVSEPGRLPEEIDADYVSELRTSRNRWRRETKDLRVQLSAALARAERAEKVLTEACQMQSILLMAGEMTAQERRTAQAVANGIAAKVRTALTHAPDQPAGREALAQEE